MTQDVEEHHHLAPILHIVQLFSILHVRLPPQRVETVVVWAGRRGSTARACRWHSEDARVIVNSLRVFPHSEEVFQLGVGFLETLVYVTKPCLLSRRTEVQDSLLHGSDGFQQQ